MSNHSENKVFNPTRKSRYTKIFEFIEVFYNRQRMHSYLGYMSPVEFESAAAKAA